MRRRSGLIASRSLLLALLTAALSGCLYGFAGGGLPPSIKTVALLPFDNQTAEPTLTQEVATSVREALQSRLGLRPASETQADAVVRGTIVRYDPDVPVQYQGQETSRVVNVTKREVQITVS
ncbi:MAG TPA: LPS assembly lipoprotein LptE, partial [Gemmatimonadales bacterium]|nr:LPS assembly lipoprotein LptE [Gemmatimonadales bacterium]